MLKQTIVTPFNFGYLIASMEQFYPTDPYRANFDSMQLQNASGWSNWPNWDCFQDNTDTYGAYADGTIEHIQIDQLGDGTCGDP